MACWSTCSPHKIPMCYLPLVFSPCTLNTHRHTDTQKLRVTVVEWLANVTSQEVVYLRFETRLSAIGPWACSCCAGYQTIPRVRGQLHCLQCPKAIQLLHIGAFFILQLNIIPLSVTRSLICVCVCVCVCVCPGVGGHLTSQGMFYLQSLYSLFFLYKYDFFFFKYNKWVLWGM